MRDSSADGAPYILGRAGLVARDGGRGSDVVTSQCMERQIGRWDLEERVSSRPRRHRDLVDDVTDLPHRAGVSYLLATSVAFQTRSVYRCVSEWGVPPSAAVPVQLAHHVMESASDSHVSRPCPDQRIKAWQASQMETSLPSSALHISHPPTPLLLRPTSTNQSPCPDTRQTLKSPSTSLF